MSLRDRDLISIQEARELVARAAEAQARIASYTQEQVDAVVDACAEAATAAAERLAKLAVEETGYGNVPDKVVKNRFASIDVHRAIRGMKTVGILREDPATGIAEVATPVGIVAAVIPSTNPTSTAIYKTLIAVKARNAIVHSPHPSAVRCIRETVDLLARAARQVGAPEGLITCMEHPTLQGTQELMRHRNVGVILATGGAGLVRAAYGSGKPAYGVGPGNVPAFVERSADIPKAVADIFAGKTFDYGTICSSEQAIVAEEPVAAQVLEECRRQGAYLLSPEETRKLGELVITPGTFTPNPKIVGKPATLIAEMAAIKVPPDTRVMIAKLEGVGREHPLSAEKLSPILAFYSVPNVGAAIDLCTRLLHFGGLGHTVAIHSKNDAAIREFGQAVPAFRVCVNTAAVHGSVGYSTNLFPSLTLGCGALGGNITSDNIGPQHLINIKRIARESRPVEHRTVAAEQRMQAEVHAPAPPSGVPSADTAKLLAPGPLPLTPSREVIARVVERVFVEHGIPRRGALAAVAAAPAQPPSAPGPAEIAAEVAARVFRTPPAPPAPASLPAPPAPEAQPLIPAVQIAAFVSEADVRAALSRHEKIYIGPKTIVTPSARDLASAHDVLVETELAPTPESKSTRPEF